MEVNQGTWIGCRLQWVLGSDLFPLHCAACSQLQLFIWGKLALRKARNLPREFMAEPALQPQSSLAPLLPSLGGFILWHWRMCASVGPRIFALAVPAAWNDCCPFTFFTILMRPFPIMLYKTIIFCHPGSP